MLRLSQADFVGHVGAHSTGISIANTVLLGVSGDVPLGFGVDGDNATAMMNWWAQRNHNIQQLRDWKLRRPFTHNPETCFCYPSDDRDWTRAPTKADIKFKYECADSRRSDKDAKDAALVVKKMQEAGVLSKGPADAVRDIDAERARKAAALQRRWYEKARDSLFYTSGKHDQSGTYTMNELAHFGVGFPGVRRGPKGEENECMPRPEPVRRGQTGHEGGSDVPRVEL